MGISTITESECRQYINQLEPGYFLIESQLLEDGDYNLQAQTNPMMIPPARSARDIVDEVDPYTTDNWIWAETLFDDHQ